MSGEIDRPGWVQLARTRQEPGSYEMQLVPEALNLIRAVAHEDQDIHRAIAGLSDDHTRALKEADTEESFKKAISEKETIIKEIEENHIILNSPSSYVNIIWEYYGNFKI